MVDKRLRYEESFADDYSGEITHYFIGDKTLLCELTGNAYPEADGMTLSITQSCSNSDITVSMSPYTDDGSNVEDYDWIDIDIPAEEIRHLLVMTGKC